MCVIIILFPSIVPLHIEITMHLKIVIGKCTFVKVHVELLLSDETSDDWTNECKKRAKAT